MGCKLNHDQVKVTLTQKEELEMDLLIAWAMLIGPHQKQNTTLKPFDDQIAIYSTHTGDMRIDHLPEQFP